MKSKYQFFSPVLNPSHQIKKPDPNHSLLNGLLVAMETLRVIHEQRVNAVISVIRGPGKHGNRETGRGRGGGNEPTHLGQTQFLRFSWCRKSFMKA